ncbi:MAG: hypothetical protein ACYST6_13975 [Planctomycetota bacterium]|jgi:hypothetical protein
MSTQAQNLSREMILSAYKAAISPGPPIPPESTVNWQLTTVNSLLSSTLVENPLQIRPFRAKQKTNPKQTQTNPKQTQFPKDSKNNTTLLYTKGYDNETVFSVQQNEPKRTQSNPISKARNC